jgi:23S rRNA (adenine2503-C2)-methyltransferase
MKIVSKVGNDNVATVYIADLGKGRLVEFVESVQPPISREKKWVLIVSTLFGCPVGCRICDAGNDYQGKLSAEEMFAQIEFLVRSRFPDGKVPVEKFKIQFARMGEPAFNPAVLDVLDQLPERYRVPGLMPSVSTVAPLGADRFFDQLLTIKRLRYPRGRFQLQFSIHSTDRQIRDWLIPVKKWDLRKIAEYGETFFEQGDRKITLNFALARNIPVEPKVLSDVFDPSKFLVKITPINPTFRTHQNNLVSYIDPYRVDQHSDELLENLRRAGYDVLLSIGEVEENKIGSNCGQFVTRYLKATEKVHNAYTYRVQSVG